MSKKHNKHYSTPAATPVTEEKPSVAAPVVPETKDVAEDPVAVKVEPAETSVESLIDAAVAEEVAKEEPKAEEVPVKPVEEPPAKVEVKTTKVQRPELTAEDILPSVTEFARKVLKVQPRSHTPAGVRLAEQFDEYKAMCSTPADKDKNEQKRRVNKLYQIMQLGCPASLNDSIVAQDLVRVAFDKLMEGWGTVYTPETIFRQDYTLSGGAAAIDKLNMYWQAMIQLVEAAKNGSRIMFDDTRLGIVLKNPIVTGAISKMKTAIIENNKNKNGIVD